MRRWIYSEPGSDTKPEEYFLLSDAEILEQFWDYWVERMIRLNKILMITEENCIEDWVCINWAVPFKETHK